MLSEHSQRYLTLDPERVVEAHRVWGFTRYLRSRELEVVCRRLDGQPYREIGEALGLHWEGVRQIHLAALKKLRLMWKWGVPWYKARLKEAWVTNWKTP
jgi:DNA-directed RNA polymerase sigma subunit (sigma70/sigma32)